MKITINQVNPPINIIRKIKLNKINRNKIQTDYIKYNWKITPENINEDLRDFHLFCLSIAMELIDDNSKTNEIGKIEYIKIKKSKKDISKIKELFEYIANDKKKYPDKYKKNK